MATVAQKVMGNLKKPKLCKWCGRPLGKDDRHYTVAVSSEGAVAVLDPDMHRTCYNEMMYDG